RDLARAMCASGDEGKTALVEVLKEPGSGLTFLLEALEECGAPSSSAPVLITLVRQGGPESVLAARLLGKLRVKEGTDVLLEALKDPATVCRREVLWALGQIGDKGASLEVGKDLLHESPEVRAAAAQALGSIGLPAQKKLLEALTYDYYRIV